MLRLEKRNFSSLPVLLIIILPFLMFGRALLTGKVMSPADILYFVYPWHAVNRVTPQNPLLSDVAQQFHPWLIYSIREIYQGRFPFWNPHALAGAPLFGNGQSALLFPLTWLGLILPLSLSIGLSAISKVAIAGLCMYWMLRVLDLSTMASTLGAIAFMFNGYLIVWLGYSATNVAIWLPLLVGLIERLRQTSQWCYAGYLALAVGFQFLGGHPETSFQIVFIASCYALYRVWGQGGPRFALQFAVAGALGGLLAAVQFLPFLDYLSHSAIAFIRQPANRGAVLPPRAAVALLVPNYFGSPARNNFWGPANFNEFSAYVGVVPLLLASCAVIGGWKRATIRFFLAMSLLGAAAAYGFAPLIWLFSELPIFSRAANHRLILALAFGLCVLGAFGLDVLREAQSDLRRRLFSAMIAVPSGLIAIMLVRGALDHREILARGIAHFVLYQCAVFAVLLTASALIALRMLRRHGHPMIFGISLIGLELLSFLPFVPTYNPIISKQQFYPFTPSLEFLRHDQSTFRVLLPPKMPNLGAVYELSDVAGYDSMAPLYLVQLLDGIQSLGGWGNLPVQYTTNLNSALTDLLNIKYVLRPPRAQSPGPKFTIAYDGRDARIFQNTNVFPRAFLVPRARNCLDDSASIAAIRDEKINLREEVILAGCAPFRSGESPSPTPAIEVYEPERIVISANPSSYSFLVLTDSYDAGWRVSVDGREAPLLRADVAFRAVALNPGAHRVEFIYRPRGLRVGLFLSLIALIAIVGSIYFGCHPPRVSQSH